MLNQSDAHKEQPGFAGAGSFVALSGACTVEIAAFDEFSKLLGDPAATAGFDHVVFDTAPTGHTLRLLELPAAWSGFLDSNVGGTSCLGPLAGLNAQRELYQAALAALGDPQATILVLVSRPERTALDEAERTRAELAALGITNQRLILNGMFTARNGSDPIACALEARGRYEAAQLQRDLARAGIAPFAWVINQSLTPLAVHDPVLVSRRCQEAQYIEEVQGLATRVALTPWRDAPVRSLLAKAAA